METFDGRKGKKLPHEITGDLRFFGYFTGNDTLLINYGESIDMIYEKSDGLGNVFGITLFANYDGKGNKPHLDKDYTSISEYIEMLNANDTQDLVLLFTEQHIREDKNWRAAIIRFMRDLGNRKLKTIPLKGYRKDYRDDVIDYGGSMEMLTAIFCNVLRMDSDQNVINEEWARYRASQYIRSWKDNSYKVVPRWKEWEMWLWM